MGKSKPTGMCAKCGHTPYCHLSSEPFKHVPKCGRYVPCSKKPVCDRFVHPATPSLLTDGET